jgi:hypothetical protein
MFAYAIDGVALFDVTDEDIDPGDEEIPAGLRPAVDAAGIFGSGDLDEGEPDFAINMRVLCALAGLQCTLDDLRQIPLLVAPFS